MQLGLMITNNVHCKGNIVKQPCHHKRLSYTRVTLVNTRMKFPPSLSWSGQHKFELGDVQQGYFQTICRMSTRDINPAPPPPL